MMKDFKSPDLNAPRFRPKILDIVNDEFFKDFKEKYPEYKKISNREIKDKISLINGEIWKTALMERDGVELL